MSIKSELTKTASYLRNARNAIIGRGGEISLTAGLKDLSDAIYAIPSDAALVYQTEESIAYRKSVPTNVLNFAKVSKVGGMSYKSKNLVDVGTVTFDVSKTFNVSSLEVGKTYYISTRITSNDTDTTTNQIGVRYEDDTYFYPLFTRDTRVKRAFTPTKNVISMTLFAGQNYPLSAGDTATYEDFMVCEENTDVYEPYFAGLRHTKVTEMMSEGANLIPFSYYTKEGTYNGLTYTVNDDGSVHIKGTATASNTFFLVRGLVIPTNTKVTISGSSANTNVNARKITADGVDSPWFESSDEQSRTSELNEGEKVNFVGLYTPAGKTVDETIYPMLNYGTTAAPYKPYRADNPIGTLAIPEAVQALDGYGESNPENPDEYNYLDFDRMEFFAVGHIVDGVWVRYETPIVTDVTEYFTAMPFIEVEGGGTLTAVNEYEQAAPSTINYITETAGI